METLGTIEHSIDFMQMAGLSTEVERARKWNEGSAQGLACWFHHAKALQLLVADEAPAIHECTAHSDQRQCFNISFV
jgi:hypothetical protein